MQLIQRNIYDIISIIDITKNPSNLTEILS